MACVVRVRVDVQLGTGRAAQRVHVEVAEPSCALRPCLDVSNIGVRRTGDPPVVCRGLNSTCPLMAPEPDPSLATVRGVSRRQVDLVMGDPAAARAIVRDVLSAAAELATTLDDTLGPEA